MPAGTLYLVATPLGNLDDISKRAADCLGAASVVFAEDTRRSRILMHHLGLSPDLRSLHQHNERKRAYAVLKRLAQGDDVTLITDAGTPGVSDPGAVLVRAAVEAGYRVSPIPGPSALASALSVAGFPEGSTNVLYVGFVPAKGAGRRTVLAQIESHPGVVVVYETPHRIAATLGELACAQPERLACICRELTKLHEEIRHGSVAELVEWASGGVKGELTLVLGPSGRDEPDTDAASVDVALQRCLDAGMSARDAATAVAAVLGLPRRQIYKRSVEMAKG